MRRKENLYAAYITYVRRTYHLCTAYMLYTCGVRTMFARRTCVTRSADEHYCLQVQFVTYRKGYAPVFAVAGQVEDLGNAYIVS